MAPPRPGSLWAPRTDRDPALRLDRWRPVLVIAADDRTVVTTDAKGRPGRVQHTSEAFRFYFRKAPAGTPAPPVWPRPATPVDGAMIVRLGDVPVGWLYRDGWEEPGEWTVRADDDRSYEGALVECRPPLEIPPPRPALPVRPRRKTP